ncbi:MAG: NAD(P)H-dependent glycerol-3-phosphate dehydrogenase [Usitatibacter sp.]
MKRISVIGGGAFGTAMACVARRSGNDVVLWAREAEVVDSVNRDAENKRFLAGARMPPGIRATADLAQAAKDADFVLMAVPSQHMRAVAGALRPALARGVPVVSCAKGVERGSAQLMPEVLADMLPDAVIAVLSGPSFAREIASDLPCGVALACRDWAAGESVARELSNPHFCVHLSSDVPGTALAGAMKNVISIASGVAHARKLGENARATLITLGLEESARLGLAKGARIETFLGLAGAGDFILTAHSLQSRYTSLGVALGEGRRLADVLGERKEGTEGAFSVEAVALLARRLHVEMPITAALDGLLDGSLTIDAAIAHLLKHLPALCRAGHEPLHA